MPRCSKVVIGTHAVLADGSLLAGTGALLAAQSAKAHLVPVVVCSGMYKFCAHFLAGDDLLGPSADLGSPLEVLPEAADADFNESGADCEVISPYYDRVPADLVSLFITNLCVAAWALGLTWQRRASVVHGLSAAQRSLRLTPATVHR